MFLEKFRLDGQVAAVTGGGRGIGLACAEALGEAGARLVILERDESVAAEGMAALTAKGYDAKLFACDVTDAARVTAIADELAAGGAAPSVLVNNAGIADVTTPAEEISDASWRTMFEVNLHGTFWCCRAFGRHMLAAGRGAVVNVGSMSGFIVNRPQDQAHYNASKAAVHHLTRSLAAEWAGRGVRVNAVAPTYVETVMTKIRHERADWVAEWERGTPMGRLGKPEEIASVVLFLASEAASLLTGSIVLADAGYSAW